MGTETWLDPNIKSSEIFPEYQPFDIARRDRPSDPHGGVIIIAKKGLHLRDVSLSKNLEMISGTIKLEDRKKMVLVTYYRSPHQTDETINRLCKQEIMELRNKHEKDIFVLAGDFSLPDINWSEQTISSNQYTVGTNQTYLAIASANGLEQIIDFPTRNENTLDLIFTSHPSYKQRCKPIPAIGNSDHDIVLLDIACNPIKPKPTRHKISLWKKANIYQIQEDLIVFGGNFRDQTFDSIESMWNHFRRKTSQKHRAHEKARRTKKKRDRDRYKRLQQEVQRETRKAHKQYMEDVVSDGENRNKFWSYIKSKGQEFSGVAPLKNKAGFIQSDNLSKANILNDQFHSVFTKEDHTNFPDKGPSPYSTMKNINISIEGVYKLLKKTNILTRLQAQTRYQHLSSEQQLAN